MSHQLFIQGNEAAGWGSLAAGADAFFGYPITPVNEIGEWCAAEFPKRDKLFLQTPSEIASINMLYGAASLGTRAFTATSGPGWGLMQETLSHMSLAEVPCVVLICSRGGPGHGTTRHGQSEYFSATRGGGQGGYRQIVLAPASAQEMHDFMQLGFYLADKYRTPLIVLADGIIGQTAELVEIRTLDFGPLPDKDWALKGKQNHADSKRRIVTALKGRVPVETDSPPVMDFLSMLTRLDRKFRQIEASEVRFEEYLADDADICLVAYGYCSRVCKEAAKQARSRGIKAGLVRPITLWPFPYQPIRSHAMQGCDLLVVEDTLGQMVEDVRLAAAGKGEVHLLGALAHHDPTDAGALFPGRVLEEIIKLARERHR